MTAEELLTYFHLEMFHHTVNDILPYGGVNECRHKQ